MNYIVLKEKLTVLTFNNIVTLADVCSYTSENERDQMTWLNKIQTALENVTEAEENTVEPEYRVRTNDHIVGIANSQLRKLYYLYQKSVEEEQAAKIAVKEKPLTHKEYRFRINEVNRLLVIREALREIFWASCIDDFPELLGRRLIGIRHEWKVVWCEQEVPRVLLHITDEE